MRMPTTPYTRQVDGSWMIYQQLFLHRVALTSTSIAYCANCPTQRKETFPFPLQPAFTAPNSPSYP